MLNELYRMFMYCLKRPFDKSGLQQADTVVDRSSQRVGVIMEIDYTRDRPYVVWFEMDGLSEEAFHASGLQWWGGPGSWKWAEIARYNSGLI